MDFIGRPATPISDKIFLAVTRTHKTTDRDHAGLANGTASPEEHLPRYFAKASGYVTQAPKATKKAGNGRGNWGVEGVSELVDCEYNSNKIRRRTNSITGAAGHSSIKTKFDYNDDIPVFDEELHGASAAAAAAGSHPPQQTDGEDSYGYELDKQSTMSSVDSVKEEDSHALADEGQK